MGLTLILSVCVCGLQHCLEAGGGDGDHSISYVWELSFTGEALFSD